MGARPRVARNLSIRVVKASAEIDSGCGLAGAFGSDGALGMWAPGTTPLGTSGTVRTLGTDKGRNSYATRLMLIKCLGVMLSEVMFPPKPPQPSVMAGSRPVVNPIDPWVVGVFTQMR